MSKRPGFGRFGTAVSDAWYFQSEIDKDEMIQRCEQDRDSLLKAFRRLYPRFEHKKRPADVLRAIISDVCGFRIAPRPLVAGQLALCDFQQKIVYLNSDIKRFVHHKTTIETLNNSTLAHELGHIQLHADEMADRTTVTYYTMSGMTQIDHRDLYREREADLYASIFLVPKLQLLQNRQGYRLREAYKNGREMSSSTIWKLVYNLARSFQVSPTLMRRRLLELGWLSAGPGSRTLRIARRRKEW